MGNIKHRRWIALVSIALFGVGKAFALPNRTAIAVMPFAAQDGAAEIWLSKGLPDMMIRDLSAVPAFAVVERERLKDFLDELELGKAPLFDQQSALRLGRVARVDQVLYGSYVVHGQNITVSIFLLDLATQHLLQTEEQSGKLSNISQIASDLILRVVKKHGVSVSDSQRNLIVRPVTDSINALEHFYRALTAYDNGQYSDALGEFLAAVEQDPQYADARLWIGRIYEAQGRDEHAVLTYREVFQRAAHSEEALDGLFFAGKLLRERMKQPERALAQFRTIAQIAPASPQALEASFQLGEILESQQKPKEAYQAYRFIERFRAKAQLDPDQSFRSTYTSSRFLTWDHAIQLYPDAMVRAVLLFDQLVQSGEQPSPPRGVILLSSAINRFVEDSYRQTPSFFLDQKDYPDWKEDFYVAVAPQGFEFTGVELAITGQLNIVQTNRDYALRVLPFPLPRQYMNRWLGAIYGQTPKMTALRKHISFHGENRRLVTLQLMANGSEIKGWAVQGNFKPMAVTPAKAGVQAQTPLNSGVRRNDGFYEGKPLAEIPLVHHGFSAATRPTPESYYGPERRLAILMSGAKEKFLIMARGDLTGEPTDLYVSRSNDGKNFNTLDSLSVNSPAEDYDPRLVSGEDGKARLAWLSNRRGRGWEIWVSEFSGAWSEAWRIPLEKFINPGMEQLAGSPTTLLEYDLMQTRRGWWILAYYSRVTLEFVFLRSRDLRQWELFSHVPAGEAGGLSLIQDGTDRFWLSAMQTNGALLIGNSIDGKNWESNYWPDYRSATPAVARTQMFKRRDGTLALLISDKVTGLQYAVWPPGTALPKLDLVSGADIQNFAAAMDNMGGATVALESSESIGLRSYKNFNESGKNAEKDNPGWAIYIETSQDRQGNTWKRYSARERSRVPDVLSVGVEAGGRIWWGIESGIMALHKNEFFATDVSQGFFNNDVTEITACPNLPAQLTSRAVNEPIIGTVENTGGQPIFRTHGIPGGSGAILGGTCGSKPGEVIFDTSKGETWKLGEGHWSRADPSTGPTAKRKSLLVQIKNPVYATVGPAAKDPVKGIWYLPGEDIVSKGIAYYDGQTTKLYNPPHGTLEKPSALAVDNHGAVWVGTWFNGLFKLDRKKN